MVGTSPKCLNLFSVWKTIVLQSALALVTGRIKISNIILKLWTSEKLDENKWFFIKVRSDSSPTYIWLKSY